jgi:hypothetical protein
LKDRKRAIEKALGHLAMVFILADEESNNNAIIEYVKRGTVNITTSAKTDDGLAVPISITVGKPIKKRAVA